MSEAAAAPNPERRPRWMGLGILVGVILVLLCLAVPRFSSSTEAALQSECIAHLGAIETAIARWEEKNRATFPTGWISADGRGGDGRDRYDLSPYVDARTVFRCPAARGGAGEHYYYMRPGDREASAPGPCFPGVNCHRFGRPVHLGDPSPHTTETRAP